MSLEYLNDSSRFFSREVITEMGDQVKRVRSDFCFWKEILFIDLLFKAIFLI